MSDWSVIKDGQTHSFPSDSAAEQFAASFGIAYTKHESVKTIVIKCLDKPLYGHTSTNPLSRFIDHRETHGREVVRRFAAKIGHIDTAVDLGAFQGEDLSIVKSIHPNARLIGIESNQEAVAALKKHLTQDVFTLDLERDKLPFEDESVDFIMANQVLEHTKEIFWIAHEITRSLKVGGHFLLGVPNVASLHNRLMMLFGIQPTQHKLCSAHVRPFSKGDTLKFFDACFHGGYELTAFEGAQFYPFAPVIGRPLCKAFPAMAFSIFFLFKKVAPYKDDPFLKYAVPLETNFFLGHIKTRFKN